MKWNKNQWIQRKQRKKQKNEQGHALYLVIVISFLLFMVLSHFLFYYLNQVSLVQMKEENLRSHALLQSAVVLWAHQMDNDAFINQLTLEDGEVRFYLLDNKEEYWYVRVAAQPLNSSAKQRAEVKIDKETKKILDWTYKISDITKD